MTTLAEAVRRDRSYKSLISKELSTRERAIEQAILRVGEEMIGPLTIEIATLKGKLKEAREKSRADKKHLELKLNEELFEEKLESEKQRTKFALILGGTGRLFNSMARSSVTPWHQLLGAPADSQSLSVVHSNTMAPTDNLFEVTPSPTQTVSIKDGKAKTTASSKFAHRLLYVFPKPVKAFVIPIAEFFTTLSPLSTAILFIATFLGMWAWGEYSKSSLEKSYDQLVDDKKQLSERLASVTDARDKAVEAGNKVPSLEATIESLKAAYSTQKGSYDRLELEKAKIESDHRSVISTLTESHRLQLMDARKDANTDLKAENDRLVSQYNEVTAKFDSLSLESKKQAEDIGRLKEVENIARKTSGELDLVRNDKKTFETKADEAKLRSSQLEREVGHLLGLVSGMKAELDTGLIVADASTLEAMKRTFRERFNKLHKASADYFDRNGIYRYGYSWP